MSQDPHTANSLNSLPIFLRKEEIADVLQYLWYFRRDVIDKIFVGGRFTEDAVNAFVGEHLCPAVGLSYFDMYRHLLREHNDDLVPDLRRENDFILVQDGFSAEDILTVSNESVKAFHSLSTSLATGMIILKTKIKFKPRKRRKRSRKLLQNWNIWDSDITRESIGSTNIDADMIKELLEQNVFPDAGKYPILLLERDDLTSEWCSTALDKDAHFNLKAKSAFPQLCPFQIGNDPLEYSEKLQRVVNCAFWDKSIIIHMQVFEGVSRVYLSMGGLRLRVRSLTDVAFFLQDFGIGDVPVDDATDIQFYDDHFENLKNGILKMAE